MGKGGAPTTTQTTQNQNLAYVPTGLQGFQDIYGKAAQVASQPYQAYGGQLVQGLTPTQTSAIGQISGIGPLTAGNIQQYMNPFQNDVINATIGNINETNRQQMADTTGKLQQAAGGIGAERIALGQGELARQQALASNQTLAGLNQQNYMQALQTAQQQQGFGLGKAQAQLGAGALEQQTGQAGLTAQYQQYLQQLAFPYQQMQFLAGVGLPALGAMGGQQFQTGTANQTMTPPGMSWLQALAGAGALGYGAYSGWGGGGGGSGGGAGDVTGKGGMASGGGVDDDDKTIDLGPDEYRSHDDALAPVLSDQGYVPTIDKPIQMPDSMPKPMAPIQSQQPNQGSGGNGSTLGTLASIGKTVASIIPFLAEGGSVPHYDDGGSAPMGSGMAYPSPAMLGSPLTRGALPAVANFSSPNVFYGRQLPNMLPPYPVSNPQQAGQNAYDMARQVLQQQELGRALASFRSRASDQPDVSVSEHEYARGGYADGGYSDDDLDNVISPYVDSANYATRSPVTFPPSADLDSTRYPNTEVGYRFPEGMPSAHEQTINEKVGRRYPFELPLAKDTEGLPEVNRRSMSPGDLSFMNMDAAQNLKTALNENAARRRGLMASQTPNTDAAPTDISGDNPYPRPRPQGGGFDPATASPSDILNLNNYRNQVAQRPTVRGLMGNPDFWMRAGLNILSANPAKGPLGAIASGAAGTVGNFDQWSKEDLSSKQKAQELAGKLMEHSQKFTRLTANEKARLNLEYEKLQQGHYQAVNYTDDKGQLHVGRFNTRNGTITDSEGNPVSAQRIFGRSSRMDTDKITPQQMSIIIDRYRKNHPTSVGMSDDDVRGLALKEIQAGQQPVPSTALPIPKNKDELVKGSVYKTPWGDLPWDGEKFVK